MCPGGVPHGAENVERGGTALSILDYGIEDAEDSASCQRNLAGFLRAVDLAATLPPTSVSNQIIRKARSESNQAIGKRLRKDHSSRPHLIARKS